jgi:AraC-like DNA-binding protein
MATCNWGMVVTRLNGQTSFTIRGPETIATMADCPGEGEWVGVHFRLGTYMPLFPAGFLRNRNDVTLPPAARKSFYLNGSVWECPTFENIDTFVQRLVARGLIVADPLVLGQFGSDSPRADRQRTSLRTGQRRVMRATGMTHATIRQIERARAATQLLQDGTPPARVALDLGYFDQAHLTRSLKRFMGQTPTQIARGNGQLSLLYKKQGRR